MTSGPTFTIGSALFDAPQLQAGLYVVATPIGNLRDITLRALETLAACQVIACEDTRTSAVLLGRYGIATDKVSYTEHNADHRGAQLLKRIGNGDAVALISDAGMPVISDPGARLVQQAIDAGLPVTVLPGASAPVTALVASGLAGGGFSFHGFLPTKKGARRTILEGLKARMQEDHANMMFESPSRLLSTLDMASEIFGGQHRAVVARELTKMHETLHRGTLDNLIAEFQAMDRIRGEIVLLLEGKSFAEIKDPDALLREALQQEKPGAAASRVAALTGLSRQKLYKRALALKDAP